MMMYSSLEHNLYQTESKARMGCITYLHAGASDPRETIENPDARTPSDWNHPAKARWPGGKSMDST